MSTCDDFLSGAAAVYENMYKSEYPVMLREISQKLDKDSFLIDFLITILKNREIKHVYALKRYLLQVFSNAIERKRSDISVDYITDGELEHVRMLLYEMFENYYLDVFNEL